MKSKVVNYVILIFVMIVALIATTGFVVKASSLLPAAVGHAAYVPADQSPDTLDMNDPVRIYILGLVASGLAWLIHFAAAKFGKNLDLTATGIIVFAVSLGLAWVWAPPKTPVCSTDMAACINSWMIVIVAIVGTATTLYNVVLKKLLSLIGAAPGQVSNK